MALVAFRRRLWGQGGAALLLIALLAILLSACSVVQGAFEPLLPPPETLQLQARLMPGGGAIGGSRTVRISWLPPEGDVDFVIVIEQAKSPEGPWEEIKTVRPSRGFHEETSIYRPGRFYYFRAFLVRGSDETAPGPPVELWVPSEGPISTPTPRPTSTPRPTATPSG